MDAHYLKFNVNVHIFLMYFTILLNTLIAIKKYYVMKYLYYLNLLRMTSVSRHKTWTVVKFVKGYNNGEDTVEAIPSSWIVGDECMWPPLIGNKLKYAIQHHEIPDDNWQTFKISQFENSTFGNIIQYTI